MIASEDSDVYGVYKAKHGYGFGFCGDVPLSSLKFSFSFWSSRLSLFYFFCASGDQGQ
jgi:hypothetical protein